MWTIPVRGLTDETSSRAELLPDPSGTGITYRMHLPPTPPHSLNILSTLALIKSSPTLDSLVPLGTQLHFVLLSASSSPSIVDDGVVSGVSSMVTTPLVSTPYDGLHSLVHWGVAPWFDSYINSKQGLSEGQGVGKKGGEAQMGLLSIMTELTVQAYR